MMALWQRLPVVVRAVLSGMTVATVGTLSWALLGSANGRYFIAVPWAVVPATLGLWLFWRYLRGEGWPRSTARMRRESLRANPLPAEVWPMAIMSGLLGLSTIPALTGLMARLVVLPPEAQSTKVPDGMPAITLIILLLMAAVVAGVVEEAAFRGYMQGPIERRHGVVIAILVNGFMFGLGHFTHHPRAVFVMMPYYITLTAIWGGLAWITNSVLPGIVLHALGDVFSFAQLFTSGTPEWQATSGGTQPPLVWQTGPDAAFWGYLITFLVLGTAAVWMYAGLRASVRELQSAPST